MASSVTLKTVARKAGLSVSTVCLALAGHARVSQETQAHVRRISEELDYRGGGNSRGLGDAAFGIVILGVGHTDKSSAGLVPELSHAAAARHWRMEIIAIPDARDTAAVKTRLAAASHKLRGLFLTEMVNQELMEAVAALELPALVLGDIIVSPAALPPSPPLTQITPDTIDTGCAATRYLLAQRRTPVMFLSYEGPKGLFHDRWLTGYLMALAESRMAVDDTLIVQTTPQSFAPDQLAKQLAGLHPGPQGFVLPDPELAVQFIAAMRRLNQPVLPHMVVLGGTRQRALNCGLDGYPLLEADISHWAQCAIAHMEQLARGQLPGPETIHCRVLRHCFP